MATILTQQVKNCERQILLLFILFPLFNQAQENKKSSFSPAVTLVNTEQRNLNSKMVDQEFEIYVSLPDGYTNGTEKYPVLYLTDANTYFGLMTDISRNLQWGGEMPETIIVGIGYPINKFKTDDERWGKWLAWRMRDLSPSHNPQADKDFGLKEVKSGGGPDFLAFIEKELIPFIEKEYRADETNRTYAGFSLGGLFGLYALFEKPELFQNFIVGSASIWYDNKRILQNEKVFSENHDDLPAKVFLSAGELEEELNAGMVRNMLELNSLIKSRKYKSLITKTAILEGETHMSAPSVSFQRGLRFLFRE